LFTRTCFSLHLATGAESNKHNVKPHVLSPSLVHKSGQRGSTSILIHLTRLEQTHKNGHRSWRSRQSDTTLKKSAHKLSFAKAEVKFFLFLLFFFTFPSSSKRMRVGNGKVMMKNPNDSCRPGLLHCPFHRWHHPSSLKLGPALSSKKIKPS